MVAGEVDGLQALRNQGPPSKVVARGAPVLRTAQLQQRLLGCLLDCRNRPPRLLRYRRKVALKDANDCEHIKRMNTRQR